MLGVELAVLQENREMTITPALRHQVSTGDNLSLEVVGVAFEHSRVLLESMVESCSQVQLV